MFRPIPYTRSSTGDPIRDGELDKAQQVRLPIGEMLATLTICVLIVAVIAQPHTAAMLVGKIINLLATLAHRS